MNNATVPGSSNIIGESAKNRTLSKEQKITLHTFQCAALSWLYEKLVAGLSSVARGRLWPVDQNAE